VKLSERIASGENTRELHGAIATLTGWIVDVYEDHQNGDIYTWKRLEEIRRMRPDYLTDIRLTFADINRQGWNWLKCLDERGHTIYAVYTDDGSDIGRAVYDGNDARCACEALVIALEWVGI
jgi:DUF971 family protein